MPERIRFDSEENAVLDYAHEAKQRSDKTKYLTLPVVAGEIALTVALLVGLFMVYQLKYTSVTSAREQDKAISTLQESWNEGTTTDGEELPGGVSAILRVQKFENGKEYPVFNGIDQDILAKGPGIYPATQSFGEKGNTAIAAHRDGWNAPFSEIDTLDTCDVIEVEAQSAVYTYKVPSSAPTPEQREKENEACFNRQQVRALGEEQYVSMVGHSIVAPEQTNVTWAVPAKERYNENAGLSLLTLTSCHPHWSNEQRYIVHAVNTDIKRKK